MDQLLALNSDSFPHADWIIIWTPFAPSSPPAEHAAVPPVTCGWECFIGSPCELSGLQTFVISAHFISVSLTAMQTHLPILSPHDSAVSSCWMIENFSALLTVLLFYQDQTQNKFKKYEKIVSLLLKIPDWFSKIIYPLRLKTVKL